MRQLDRMTANRAFADLVKIWNECATQEDVKRRAVDTALRLSQQVQNDHQIVLSRLLTVFVSILEKPIHDEEWSDQDDMFITPAIDLDAHNTAILDVAYGPEETR